MHWIHRDGRLRKQVWEVGSEVRDYAGHEERRRVTSGPFLVRGPFTSYHVSWGRTFP